MAAAGGKIGSINPAVLARKMVLSVRLLSWVTYDLRRSLRMLFNFRPGLGTFLPQVSHNGCRIIGVHAVFVGFPFTTTCIPIGHAWIAFFIQGSPAELE